MSNIATLQWKRLHFSETLAESHCSVKSATIRVQCCCQWACTRKRGRRIVYDYSLAHNVDLDFVDFCLISLLECFWKEINLVKEVIYKVTFGIVDVTQQLSHYVTVKWKQTESKVCLWTGVMGGISTHH